MYNPTGLDEERLSWRTVIFFNIARPVRRILDALDAYGDGDDDCLKLIGFQQSDVKIRSYL